MDLNKDKRAGYPHAPPLYHRAASSDDADRSMSEIGDLYRCVSHFKKEKNSDTFNFLLNRYSFGDNLQFLNSSASSLTSPEISVLDFRELHLHTVLFKRSRSRFLAESVFAITDWAPVYFQTVGHFVLNDQDNDHILGASVHTPYSSTTVSGI